MLTFRFSEEAKKIEEIISGPRGRREYVNYNREFLDAYRPNQTFYLDESKRKLLYEIGDLKYLPHLYLEPLGIDLSWNSSRLEGNSYLRNQARQLLEEQEVIQEKDPKEATMLLNHKRAITFMVGSIEEIELSAPTICRLHRELSTDLLGNSNACGQLRTIPVKISGSLYLPTAIPALIEECFFKIIDTASQIEDPFEQAFFLMVHLPYLQPFEDVNKRVSRVSMNIPLLKHHRCPFTFVDIQVKDYIHSMLAIYELNKVDLLRELFFWGYQMSCGLYGRGFGVGEPDPIFVKYRFLIKELVREIVLNQVSRQAVGRIVENKGSTLPTKDQKRLIQYIERELDGLHQYNIVAYQLSLEEYESWKASSVF